MHGNIMTDETIENLAASRIPLVPTLLLLSNVGDWGHLVGAPAPMRDGMKADAGQVGRRAAPRARGGCDDGARYR